MPHNDVRRVENRIM